jgi:hypothetical protein
MNETNVWLAKAAIGELITRYAALNDGRTAILAAFRSRPLRATRHIVANVLVILDGETEARASSQVHFRAAR